MKENMLILNAKYNQEEVSYKKDQIMWIKFQDEYYLINEYKGLLIKETRIPLILRNLDIPVYTGGIVHFRDVFRQVIQTGFDSTGEDFMPNKRVQAQIKRKWRKPIKRNDRIAEMADEYVAARMLYEVFARKIALKR